MTAIEEFFASFSGSISSLVFVMFAIAVLLFFLVVLVLIRMIAPRRDNQTINAIEQLDNNQHELAGGIKAIADQQSRSHAQLVEYVEKRFDNAQNQMTQTLGQTTARTSQSLGALLQRLEAIDRAQGKIEKLSGDVLGLQDILTNKQTRGNFGEIQLGDIVSNALPADSYRSQATLSNGSRVDILVNLPNPPGPIAIDSKFPLEAYEAIRNAKDERDLKAASQFFRSSIRKHIRDISEKYIIEGETADGAIMFLPSEAVYAELHANFPDVVREGFTARVWIVSPTTCMATLTTMRAVLKDMHMREQASRIRNELSLLVKDMARLSDRVGNLDRHFGQASADIEAIKTSTAKVATRSSRLETLEFDEDAPTVLPKSQVNS